MAQFFRDEQIKNTTLTEDNLKQIDRVFKDRMATLGLNSDQIFLTYVIRFDNKGYRLFSIEELLRYFSEAKEIERIIFTLETQESLRNSRSTGAHIELYLDEKTSNPCFLNITSDDKDWVDASFSVIRDVLSSCKNYHGLIRTGWTPFMVQIFGVVSMFLLSLWAAIKIAPQIAVENSFVICFIFIFLIFLNIWTPLNNRILSFVNGIFPNIKFSRPHRDRWAWLMQALIAAIVGAIIFYGINLAFDLIGNALAELIQNK